MQGLGVHVAEHVLALTWSGDDPPASWAKARAALGGPADTTKAGHTALCLVRGATALCREDQVAPRVLLAPGALGWGIAYVSDDDLAGWLGGDRRSSRVDDALPPFAAAWQDPTAGCVRVATDYPSASGRSVAVRGRGWAAVSNSSAALAELAGTSIDLDSLAAYSLVGWRLGQATHFSDVEKLGPERSPTSATAP